MPDFTTTVVSSHGNKLLGPIKSDRFVAEIMKDFQVTPRTAAKIE